MPFTFLKKANSKHGLEISYIGTDTVITYPHSQALTVRPASNCFEIVFQKIRRAVPYEQSLFHVQAVPKPHEFFLAQDKDPDLPFYQYFCFVKKMLQKISFDLAYDHQVYYP